MSTEDWQIPSQEWMGSCGIDSFSFVGEHDFVHRNLLPVKSRICGVKRSAGIKGIRLPAALPETVAGDVLRQNEDESTEDVELVKNGGTNPQIQ